MCCIYGKTRFYQFKIKLQGTEKHTFQEGMMCHVIHACIYACMLVAFGEEGVGFRVKMYKGKIQYTFNTSLWMRK